MDAGKDSNVSAFATIPKYLDLKLVLHTRRAQYLGHLRRSHEGKEVGIRAPPIGLEMGLENR